MKKYWRALYASAPCARVHKMQDETVCGLFFVVQDTLWGSKCIVRTWHIALLVHILADKRSLTHARQTAVPRWGLVVALRIRPHMSVDVACNRKSDWGLAITGHPQQQSASIQQLDRLSWWKQHDTQIPTEGPSVVMRNIVVGTMEDSEIHLGGAHAPAENKRRHNLPLVTTRYCISAESCIHSVRPAIWVKNAIHTYWL